MKVVIQNEVGQYLTRINGEIAFADSPRGAFVYDMVLDRVMEQIDIVNLEFGAIWKAIPYESTLTKEAVA